MDTVERPLPPTSHRFINYPLLLTQINRSNPGQVYSDDPKRHMSVRGTVSPEDRRFLVSSTVC